MLHQSLQGSQTLGQFFEGLYVIGLRRPSRQAIWAMSLTGHMSKLKVECQDGDYPSVKAGGGCCVGIVKHPLDVSGIYFDDKILNADKKYFVCVESTKEPIELEFWLRELSLSIIEWD